MHIRQITSPVEVVELWPTFLRGLQIVATRSNEPLDEVVMLKTVLVLADDPKIGYVSVAFADTQPVGFAIFQDATPPFVEVRSFIARAIFSENGSQGTVVHLLRAFESWASAMKVQRYIVSTRRHSGAAIRHFQSPKYGFTKGAITFEKLIK